MSITYGSALKISELLRLQEPFSPAPVHDELQYVIIHQCSELWFKLLLHEFDAIVPQMRTGDLRLAARLLRRCVKIVQTIDQGFSLMETMTAYDYAAFRPHLAGGSGFQSAQFREVEIALGCHRPETLDQPAFTAEERARIATRLQQPTLWDGFLGAMARHGYSPQQLREMYLAHAAGDLRDLSEELVELDNAILLWRTHHAAMAERAIGRKVGTGGEGVEYLYQTARTRCFPELLAMRTEI